MCEFSSEEPGAEEPSPEQPNSVEPSPEKPSPDKTGKPDDLTCAVSILDSTFGARHASK